MISIQYDYLLFSLITYKFTAWEKIHKYVRFFDVEKPFFER